MNERDPMLDLSGLDPEKSAPGYWLRFQDRVMSAALPELARRRRRVQMSVVDVVHSWSRLLVPAAVAAAAVAGMLLVGETPESGGESRQGVAALEELVLPLEADEDATVVYLMFGQESAGDDVVFALEDHWD